MRENQFLGHHSHTNLPRNQRTNRAKCHLAFKCFARRNMKYNQNLLFVNAKNNIDILNGCFTTLKHFFIITWNTKKLISSSFSSSRHPAHFCSIRPWNNCQISRIQKKNKTFICIEITNDCILESQIFRFTNYWWNIFFFLTKRFDR